MISKKLIPSFAAIVLVGGLGIHSVKAGEDDQAKLTAQAKVSKDAALATAQKSVPAGTMKEGEIENEDGKLIWSFAFTTPGTADTSEVNIDAMTGKQVGAVEVEKAGKVEADEKGGKEDKD